MDQTMYLGLIRINPLIFLNSVSGDVATPDWWAFCSNQKKKNHRDTSSSPPPTPLLLRSHRSYADQVIDTQKQILSLIRDFTSERSRGGKILHTFCLFSRDFGFWTILLFNPWRHRWVVFERFYYSISGGFDFSLILLGFWDD